jgi:hypothetical protein
MSAYGCGDSQITKKHIKLLPESSDNTFLNWMISKRVVLMFLTLLLMTTFMAYFLYSNVKMDASTNSIVGESDTVVEISQSNISDNNAVSLKEVKPGPVVRDGLDDSIMLSDETYQPFEVVVEINEASADRDTFKYRAVHKKALINSPMLLEKLLLLHGESHQWIHQLPEASYIVQLSTWYLRDLEAVISFYKQYDIPIDSLHLLIDFNKKASKFKLKAFYVTSESYSELVQAIQQLPPKLTLSKPYITTVKQLSRNIEFTSIKLKQHGIYNDGK